MANKFQCTITLIVQQDGEHYAEYDYLEQSILKVRKNNNVRYIIFFYDQTTSHYWVKELYYENENNNYFKIVQSPAKTNLYDGKDLEKFLSNFVTNPRVRAPKNIIFIWGHGSGLGYFKRLSHSNYTNNYFDEVIDDDTSFDELKELNRRVAEIIEQGTALGADPDVFNPIPLLKQSGNGNKSPFIDKFEKLRKKGRLDFISAKKMDSIFQSAGFKDNLKIDLLISSSCYVSMLETACFFASSTKLMVAPQTTFPFLSYDTETLFHYLENTNKIDFELIINMLVNSFHEKYKNEPFKSILSKYFPDPYIFDLNLVSFSGIDLEKLFAPDFSKKLNEIGDYFLTDVLEMQLNHSRQDLCYGVTLREISQANTTHPIIDMINLLQIYDSVKKDNVFSTLNNQLLNIISKDKIRINFLPAPHNPGNPSFVNIFMPYLQAPSDIELQILKNLHNIAYGNNSPIMKTFTKWGNFMKSRFAELYP